MQHSGKNKKDRSSPREKSLVGAITPSMWKTISAMAFLVVLFAIFYSPLLSGSKFLWEDYLEQAYPNVRFAAECFRHGWFPFWTPYIFGGMPFASDPQSTLFYPPYWLYLLASLFTQPGGLVYTWYIVLHILILGIGSFVLLRGMRAGRSASVFSAVTLMFAGFVSLHIFHTFIYVAAWFPFAFHFLRMSISRGEIRNAVVAGLFLGISTLGGYPQYSMHIVYFCAAWTLFSWLTTGKITLRSTLRHAICFGIFTGLGLALAAVQYVPSFENMAQSVRETMTYAESAKGSMSVLRLFTLAAPSFFGTIQPANPNAIPYWGNPGMPWCFWETCMFVGIMPLFCALCAVVDGRKSPPAIFFASVAVVCTILALGSATPFYSFLFHDIPGFKNFRIPGRFAFLFSFCIAILGGMGLQRFLTADTQYRRRCLRVVSVFGGSIIFVCLLFYSGIFTAGSEYMHIEKVKTAAQNAVIGAIVSTLIAWGAIAYATLRPVKSEWGLIAAVVVFVELFAFGHSFAIANVNPRRYYGQFDLSPLKQELASGLFRIQGRIYRGEGEGEMLFPRNLGNVASVPLVDGYNQLRLSRWNDLMWKVDVEKGRNLFNIRYGKMPGENRLMRLSTAPRFYLSTHYTTAPTRDDAIARINTDMFVPGRDIILEKDPGLDIAQGEPVSGDARVVKETPNYIELDVTASIKCLLAASELYYPAWKATLDGKKTEVLAANCAFRAVALPAGTHRVVMYYQSDAMMRGALISLTALLCAIVVLFGRRWLPAAIYRPMVGKR